MSNTLTRWRIAATRIGGNEGPPIEDEVESDERPSDSEAARVLVQKSQMQGEPVPTGATDIDRLRDYGFKITSIERLEDSTAASTL